MAAKEAQTAATASKMITVEEVMDILQVGWSTAYHTMQRLNKELRDNLYAKAMENSTIKEELRLD